MKRSTVLSFPLQLVFSGRGDVTNGGSTVVEQTPRYPKVEGLSPAVADGTMAVADGTWDDRKIICNSPARILRVLSGTDKEISE
jgi:hypothetical protein